MEKLRTDYLPCDLSQSLRKMSIDGTIAVQARQTLEETSWLLKLANENSFIKGVVGWVDLCSKEIDQQLEYFALNRKACGVRHVIQDENDRRFMMRKDFMRGIRKLAKFNLTYDLLIFPDHLPVAVELVARFPDQIFVLDHLAKPFIKDAKIEPWRSDIFQLSIFKNVVCKISGMVTEADWSNWKESDFEPYVDIVLEAFGAGNVIVGSDWPVCTLAANYSQVIGIVINYIQKLSADEQKLVWEDNPKRIYNLS